MRRHRRNTKEYIDELENLSMRERIGGLLSARDTPRFYGENANKVNHGDVVKVKKGPNDINVYHKDDKPLFKDFTQGVHEGDEFKVNKDSVEGRDRINLHRYFKTANISLQLAKMRIAEVRIEDKLRSVGRSVNEPHTHSTWLSSKGEFIGGKEPHYQQLQSPENKRYMYAPEDSDKVVTDFSRENNLPRVQKFQVNRAGEKKISIGIHSPLNSSQIKAIKELEGSGHIIGFAIGPTHDNLVTGEGFSNLIKEHARQFGQKSALAYLNKTKQRIIKQIRTKKAMKNSLADEIIDNFKVDQHKIEGVSGLYDHNTHQILDANNPRHVKILHSLYGGNDIQGYNSITDTRQGPQKDPEFIRQQLREIESTGGIPALGFDNGSLEAVNVARGKSEQDILDKLLPHQNSTGVLHPDGKFSILPNPKYKKE